MIDLLSMWLETFEQRNFPAWTNGVRTWGVSTFINKKEIVTTKLS